MFLVQHLEKYNWIVGGPQEKKGGRVDVAACVYLSSSSTRRMLNGHQQKYYFLFSISSPFVMAHAFHYHFRPFANRDWLGLSTSCVHLHFLIAPFSLMIIGILKIEIMIYDIQLHCCYFMGVNPFIQLHYCSFVGVNPFMNYDGCYPVCD